MSSFDIPMISFGGLASGLDTNSIIAGLVSVERIPINLMAQNKSNYETKISTYNTFKAQLEALQSAAEALKEDSGFKVFQVTTSLEGILTASASSDAAPGAYEIEVFSLASTEQEASQNYGDKDTTTVGTGTLTLTVGVTDPVVTNITIDPGQDTLEGVAAAINASDADVTATVINDGTSNPYRLVVTSNNTGEEASITLDSSNLTGGDTPLVFTELQAAQDAHFQINGLEMYRSSNTFSEALPGLSITLTGTTEAGSPTIMSVERDMEGIKEKIVSFVDAYNDVIKFINQQNTYNEGAESGGILMGESLVLRVSRSLQTLLIPNWNSGEEAPEVQILAQIGITFENDGTLTTSTSELDTAIDEHFDDLVSMFSDNGFADQIDAFLEEYTKFDGFVDSHNDSLKDIVNDLEDQIQRAEDRLIEFEAGLVKKFSALESLLSGLQTQQAYLYHLENQ